jgi:putative membrane protein
MCYIRYQKEGEQYMWMHGYGQYGMMRPAGFDFFSIILFILFVLFVVMLIKAIVRGSHKTESDADKESEEVDTAIQILRERYAKGDITKRQYLDMKRDLS